MKPFIENLLHYLPLIFGVGFLAPLTAEILRAYDMAPLGLPPRIAGLLLGAAWGGYATGRRGWR